MKILSSFSFVEVDAYHGKAYITQISIMYCFHYSLMKQAHAVVKMKLYASSFICFCHFPAYSNMFDVLTSAGVYETLHNCIRCPIVINVLHVGGVENCC